MRVENNTGSAKADVVGAHSARLRESRRRGAYGASDCWRCEAKRKFPLRRKRPSRAFLKICAHCAKWRVLNAEQRRAQGRKAFLPQHKRPKPDAAPLPPAPAPLEEWRAPRPRRQAREGRAADELPEFRDLPPIDEEAYAVDPNKDPLRDYTYWLQYERARKKSET